jgi:hypothetical protein
MDSSLIINKGKLDEKRKKHIRLLWSLKNYIQVKKGQCEHHIVVCLGQERDRDWDTIVCSHNKCLFCDSENIKATDKTIFINAIDYKRGLYASDIYGDCQKKMDEISAAYKNIKYYFLLDYIVRASLLEDKLKDKQREYNKELANRWKSRENQKILVKEM